MAAGGSGVRLISRQPHPRLAEPSGRSTAFGRRSGSRPTAYTRPKTRRQTQRAPCPRRLQHLRPLCRVLSAAGCRVGRANRSVGGTSVATFTVTPNSAKSTVVGFAKPHQHFRDLVPPYCEKRNDTRPRPLPNKESGAACRKLRRNEPRPTRAKHVRVLQAKDSCHPSPLADIRRKQNSPPTQPMGKGTKQSAESAARSARGSILVSTHRG